MENTLENIIDSLKDIGESLEAEFNLHKTRRLNYALRELKDLIALLEGKIERYEGFSNDELEEKIYPWL